MKKTAIFLVSVLALSAALMIVSPAMARPYQITVVVKNIPADETGVRVYIQYPISSVVYQSLPSTLVEHGKAVFSVDPPPSWYSGVEWRAVATDSSGAETHGQTYFTPNSRYSNRVIVEWAAW